MDSPLLFVQGPLSSVRAPSSHSKFVCPPHTATSRSRGSTVMMSTYEEYMRSRNQPKSESPSSTPAASSGMPTSYDEYIQKRNEGKYQGGTVEEATEGLLAFIEGGGNMEFDGGDSGGGVVGDGNVDLEDQHNSPSMVREGFTDDGGKTVKSAMNARTSSAGANYFGRSTGYAEKKIKEMQDDDIKNHKIDTVRAQQLENWHNQRQIHSTRNSDQFGAFDQSRKTPFQATTRLDKPKPAPKAEVKRLDGQSWSNIDTAPQVAATDTFELRTSVSRSEVVEIEVRNPHITFAPFRCAFTADSSESFEVSPDNGTMERRTGPPTKVLVRFTPRKPTAGDQGTLVFETEDFKKIYKFVGST